MVFCYGETAAMLDGECSTAAQKSFRIIITLILVTGPNNNLNLLTGTLVCLPVILYFCLNPMCILLHLGHLQEHL